MVKWIRKIIIVLLMAVLVFSAVKLIMIRNRYKASEKVYNDAVSTYIKPSVAYSNASGVQNASSEASANDSISAEAERILVFAPIEVDFNSLTAASRDVIGWIYCEGTVINYPVVYGVDNEFYLNHDYLGNEDPCGTIFTDMNNRNAFSDSNVILYGHHMKDKSMFAILENWNQQEFYEEHPVMWLLTPEQDYRMDIFAAYDVSADSSTYTIFLEESDLFEEYLGRMVEKSQISTTVELEPDAHYVLLSTCAYGDYLARTVLHAKLVPLDSAGGKSIAGTAAD